jgi:hypothetical protein
MVVVVLGGGEVGEGGFLALSVAGAFDDQFEGQRCVVAAAAQHPIDQSYVDRFGL